MVTGFYTYVRFFVFLGGLNISLVLFGYITEFEKKRYITKQQDGEVFDPRT